MQIICKIITQLKFKCKSFAKILKKLLNGIIFTHFRYLKYGDIMKKLTIPQGIKQQNKEKQYWKF